MKTSDDEITVTQAAEILQVSRRAVHDMIARKDLTPTRKLAGGPGAYLLSRAQVDALAKLRAAKKRGV